MTNKIILFVCALICSCSCLVACGSSKNNSIDTETQKQSSKNEAVQNEEDVVEAEEMIPATEEDIIPVQENKEITQSRDSYFENESSTEKTKKQSDYIEDYSGDNIELGTNETPMLPD